MLKKSLNPILSLESSNVPFRLRCVIKLLRPSHYAKNLFIFLPIFFGGVLTDSHALGRSTVAFICFCLAASGIYIFNDLLDVEDDRKHPTKCKRPIANEDVSLKFALALCVGCCFGALLLAAGLIGKLAFLILLSYLTLNVAYTLKLKRIALIDVFCVAMGFVLRVYLGAVVANVAVSHWLVLMTFLLSMLLVLGKRYDDVKIQSTIGTVVRKSLRGYNQPFLLQAMQLMAAINIVCYLMYATSAQVMEYYGSQYTFLTAVWVVLGVLRYFQQVLIFSNSASPTRLLYTDKFLQLTLVGWLMHFMFLIYK